MRINGPDCQAVARLVADLRFLNTPISIRPPGWSCATAGRELCRCRHRATSDETATRTRDPSPSRAETCLATADRCVLRRRPSKQPGAEAPADGTHETGCILLRRL